MRVTAAILALLIALLSCLPCADLDAAPHVRQTGTSELSAAAAPGHDHEHKGRDLCSPFCHCACCAIASALTQPLKLALKLSVGYVESDYHEHLPATPVHIAIPVWEPPR